MQMPVLSITGKFAINWMFGRGEQITFRFVANDGLPFIKK